MSLSYVQQVRYFKLWEQDPPAAMKAFIAELNHLALFEPDIVSFASRERILLEGVRNKNLYILLEGVIHLFKTDDAGVSVPVTQVLPGGMFGVMSFFSNKPALTTAIAETKCRVFRLSRGQVDLILSADSVVSMMGRQLLIANLMERYAQVVDLNARLKEANRNLDTERRRLAETLEALDAAHHRLVHQEKMATLGQLVAGVAHEINNPAAALVNAVTYLSDMLPDLLNVHNPGRSNLGVTFFQMGISSAAVSTSRQREMDQELSEMFPDLKSSQRRRLVILGDKAIAMVRDMSDADRKQVSKYLEYAEAGIQLRSIRLSSSRISGLVKSLKSYSRHETTHSGPIDIREGLHDTIQILGNRLKQISLELDFPADLPLVNADPAEMNQVWTNILVNACDALQQEGRIYIRIAHDRQCLFVRIGDDGRGVPENIRDKIFQPSFTTRNSSGNFGLGLGLSISRELVMKNGGTIHVTDSMYDGAEFVVMIPLSDAHP
jgi:signal transduction histidine kinase